MLGQEDMTTEYKLQVNDSAIKTIAAFANTEGGSLFVGVADCGKVVGVKDSDAEMLKLTNKMQMAIKPDVVMMTHVSTEQIEGMPVVIARVAKGTKRPYYLAAKGLRPEGVYVRSGAASVPAGESAIVSMIKATDGDAFETMRSFEQNLSFEYACAWFAKKKLAFGDAEKRTLGLINSDGLFTNLARLLSDQCPPTIKAASFEGADRDTFTDRAEFSGSLLRQMDEAFDYLEQRNHYVTTFKGLTRTDHRDYPEVALREALLNAVVHREYALSGPTLISVMQSGVEIVSLGGLPIGLTAADLSAHVSMPRNRLLANVFFRLELIEAYGTGIRRIMKSYTSSGTSARLSQTPNTFTVFLPNLNNSPKPQSEPSEEMQRVLSLLENAPRGRRLIQEELGSSQSSTIRLLNSMIDEGLIEARGEGRSRIYRACSN
ncbi:MAG: putative DNA binding domain-containing protein [Raoultibacter sp.]